MILAILETLCYAGHNPFTHDNLDLNVFFDCPLYSLMVLLTKYHSLTLLLNLMFYAKYSRSGKRSKEESKFQSVVYFEHVGT